MAIIKYKDKDGKLQPLGATGDHSHSLESLGAAAADHPHDVATTGNDGFMSAQDRQDMTKLNNKVFGNSEENIVGLADLVGDTKVEQQIKAALLNYVTTDGNKVLSDNNYTTGEQTKLAGIEEGAEANQNAFSEITVGETTITAGAEADKLILAAGKNITLTPVINTKTVTITADDTTYSEATDKDAGLMSTEDKVKLDGIEEGATKVTVDAEFNAESTNAVQNAVVAGAISKLNGLVGDTKVEDQISTAVKDCIDSLSVSGTTISYTTASGGSGDIKTQDTTYGIMKRAYVDQDGESGLVPVPLAGQQNKFLRGDAQWVKPPNTTYSAGNGLQLDDTTFNNTGVLSVAEGAKNGTIQVNTNGTLANIPVCGLGSAAYTESDQYETSGAAKEALEAANKHTDEQFTELVGDTSVANQISSAITSHTHKYAGSSTAGGSATSAVALDSKNVGATNQPVYFDANGKPVVISYTVNKSVPSDAVFTDTNTHYESKNVVTNGPAYTYNTSNIGPNGSVYLNNVENNQVTSSHKIYGDGNTTVTTDSNGDIKIRSTSTSASVMTGATSSSDGNSGLVPKPTSSDYIRFLAGNGTWQNPAAYIGSFSQNANGLVPAPGNGNANPGFFLDAAGNWSNVAAVTSRTDRDKFCLLGGITPGQFSSIYANAKCYVDGGHLYSNGSKVLTGGAIQCGSGTVQNIDANLSEMVQVNFNPSYTSPPCVVVSSSVPNKNVLTMVSTVTSQSAHIMVYNQGSSKISDVTFNWIAVGS